MTTDFRIKPITVAELQVYRYLNECSLQEAAKALKKRKLLEAIEQCQTVEHIKVILEEIVNEG